MPQYSRKDLIAAFRAENPDAAKISDNQIFGAIAAEDPELAKGISDLQAQPFESPKSTPESSGFSLRRGAEALIQSGRPEIALQQMVGDVGQDQAAEVLSGMPTPITGIPSTLKAAGEHLATPMSPWERGSRIVEAGKNTLQGMTNPLVNAVKGAASLAQPYMPKGVMGVDWDKIKPPSEEEDVAAAQGAGAMLTGAATPNMVAAAMKIPPAVWSKLPPQTRGAVSANFMKRAQANAIQAAKPTTLETTAITQRLAPEILRRKISGTGGSFDRQIMGGLDESGKRLAAVEERILKDVRPEMDTARAPILSDLEALRKKLHVKGTKFVHDEAALAAIDEQIAKVKQLPEYISADQLIDFNRKLDTAINDMGGWKNASSAAEKTRMKVMKGVANRFRAAKNNLDPEFRIANQDYAFYRNMADVVERRQLGDAGRTGTMIPGRGTILDDALATWAGHAAGGTTGAVLAEAVNLGLQSRGFNSLAGRMQFSAAEWMKLPPQVRKMIEAGMPVGAPGSGESAVTAVEAELIPATREIRTGRLIGPGARQLPSPEGSAATGSNAFPGFGPPDPLYGPSYRPKPKKK